MPGEPPSRRLSNKGRPRLEILVNTKEEVLPGDDKDSITNTGADADAGNTDSRQGAPEGVGEGTGKAGRGKGGRGGRGSKTIAAAKAKGKSAVAKVAASQASVLAPTDAPPPRQGVLRKPAAAGSVADALMLQQRSARDEKRRQQMCFDRTLKPKAIGQLHDPSKCPPDMVPQNKQQRNELWEAWRANLGNYDKIRATMKKTKKRHRKGSRRRIWVFESDVQDQICNGNQKRAEGMIRRLKARVGYNRRHPDVSDDETGAQVHCLEKDQNDSGEESSSEIEFQGTGTLEGTKEAQDEAMKKICASIKSPVTPKAKGAPKGGKAPKLAAIEDAPAAEEEDTAAARLAAEKQKAKEERERKASEPIEKNKKFLRNLTPALTEADIVLKDLNSKKFKSVVPSNMSADWIEMLSNGKKTLLQMRTKAEQAAAYKDAKAMAKKYKDDVEAHDKALADFKTNIKACKSSVHVYLQDA